MAFVYDTGSVWGARGETQKIIVTPGGGPGEVSKHTLGVSLIIPTLGHPVSAGSACFCAAGLPSR